jgi:hypothetical protein
MWWLMKKLKAHWITYIHNRIKANKNFICFIGGPTGAGKSWVSLSLAKQLDPNFSAENIVFSAKELMQLVNHGDLKRGSVIIFEEAGVGISSKNWYSLVNKLLNCLFQTFRHKNFIMIMNSPYMDFVDKATRKLFHAEFSVEKIDRSTSCTVLKPQMIQYNGRQQKFYYKYLRFCKGKGRAMIPIKRWHVPRPSGELVKEYEVMKSAFTRELNLSIQRDLEEDSAPKVKRRLAVCLKCGNEWNSSGLVPKKCSKCHDRNTIWSDERGEGPKHKGIPMP